MICTFSVEQIKAISKLTVATNNEYLKSIDVNNLYSYDEVLKLLKDEFLNVGLNEEASVAALGIAMQTLGNRVSSNENFGKAVLNAKSTLPNSKIEGLETMARINTVSAAVSTLAKSEDADSDQKLYDYISNLVTPSTSTPSVQLKAKAIPLKVEQKENTTSYEAMSEEEIEAMSESQLEAEINNNLKILNSQEGVLAEAESFNSTDKSVNDKVKFTLQDNKLSKEDAKKAVGDEKLVGNKTTSAKNAVSYEKLLEILADDLKDVYDDPTEAAARLIKRYYTTDLSVNKLFKVNVEKLNDVVNILRGNQIVLQNALDKKKLNKKKNPAPGISPGYSVKSDANSTYNTDYDNSDTANNRMPYNNPITRFISKTIKDVAKIFKNEGNAAAKVQVQDSTGEKHDAKLITLSIEGGVITTNSDIVSEEELANINDQFTNSKAYDDYVKARDRGDQTEGFVTVMVYTESSGRNKGEEFVAKLSTEKTLQLDEEEGMYLIQPVLIAKEQTGEDSRYRQTIKAIQNTNGVTEAEAKKMLDAQIEKLQEIKRQTKDGAVKLNITSATEGSVNTKYSTGTLENNSKALLRDLNEEYKNGLVFEVVNENGKVRTILTDVEQDLTLPIDSLPFFPKTSDKTPVFKFLANSKVSVEDKDLYLKQYFGATSSYKVQDGEVSITINRNNKSFDKVTLTNLNNAFGNVALKLLINSKYLNKDLLVIKDGELVEGETTNYMEAFSKNYRTGNTRFNIDKNQVSQDGTFKRLNPRIGFEVTEDFKPGSSQSKENNQNKQTGSAIVTPGKKVNPDRRSFTLDKIKAQKDLNEAVSEEKLKEARRWYENSELAKVIPFEAMFDKINEDGVAQFTEEGITLFAGSDYSDLYHEAFHGFSQMFMTPKQRKELYGELRKKSGYFKDFRGYTTTFRKASDEQLEEYLAEEFRTYMLKNQKGVDKNKEPKKYNLFQRMFRALRKLFSKSNPTSIALKGEANKDLNILFEKIRVGDLSGYKYDKANLSYATLNKGILAKEQDGNEDFLNYNESQEVMKYIDQMMLFELEKYSRGIYNFEGELVNEELLDLFNKYQEALRKKGDPTFKNLSEKSRDPKADTKSKIVAEIKKAKKALDDATGDIEYGVLNQVNTNIGLRQVIYEEVKNAIGNEYNYTNEKIGKILEKEQDKGLDELDKQDLIALVEKRDILDFVYENYGDVEEITKASFTEDGEVLGVIGYHMQNSDTFATFVAEDTEELDDETQLVKNLRSFDRAGNEASFKDSIGAEISFILRTLPYYDNSGNVVMGKLGNIEPMPYASVITTLGKTLQNTLEKPKMFDKLKMLGMYENKNQKGEDPKYLQDGYFYINDLLDKLGDPSDANANDQLWNLFFQTFNKARVRLTQVTTRTTVDRDPENGMPIEGSEQELTTVGVTDKSANVVSKVWESNLEQGLLESPF